MTGGRPLRFLALTLGGWIAMRIVLLFPDAAPLADRLPPSVQRLIPHLIPWLVETVIPTLAAAPVRTGSPSPPQALAVRAVRAPSDRPTPILPSPAWLQAGSARVIAQMHATGAIENGVLVPSPFAPPARHRANRLAATAWLLVRGGPAGTISGGQLGASQGGVRVTYALGDNRRFSLGARLAAPLRGAGREAALGIEWQPTALPIRLIAEQRFVLDGGRGGATLGAIAGYGPADIATGIRLEAYGQAGAIARDGIEGFVDASARVTHRLGTAFGTPVEIGIGLWGSAQRGAQRFDIGPSMTSAIPVSGKTLRLTLDWRERVAGAARPGSGPALSVGSDF